MLDQYKKNQPTAKRPVKALATNQGQEVSRPLFALPAAVWAAIDSQRQATGLTAAQYIAALVLKAGTK